MLMRWHVGRVCIGSAVILAVIVVCLGCPEHQGRARAQDGSPQPSVAGIALSTTAAQSERDPRAIQAAEAPAFAPWGQSTQTHFAPDRLIVKLRPAPALGPDNLAAPSDQDASLGEVMAAVGGVSAEALFPPRPGPPELSGQQVVAETWGLDRIFHIYLTPNTDVQQAVETLATNPCVEYAEPDYIAHTAFTPNDPRYSDQWGLPQIQADLAWDVTQGSPTVAIAIVDTGIDLDHPDLSSKLWVNPGEIPSNGLDDDANGKIDDVNGWDWVNNDKTPQDDIGHGTHVAGVAAAGTNNSVGIAGVCPNCRLMSLKVLDATGQGTYSNIAQGITYAADKGAKVINLSLGGYADSSLLHDAVAYASQYAVVVAAAGNDNRQDRFYPAAYDDYVMAVAATDNLDQKAVFSNYGDWVDISGPGVSIWSTLYNDTYGAWSGSSMVVPFVSGAAGLVRSQYPAWSAGAARAQLLHTADELDALNPGYEGKLGRGRLNAGQAVTVTAQPELRIDGYSIDDVPEGNPEPGDTVTMEVTLHNTWADATNVTATLTTTDTYVTVTDDTALYGDIVGCHAKTNDLDAFAFSVDAVAPYRHPIPFQMALSANGGAYTATLPITVPVASGMVYVSGVISNDATWTSDKTYMVTADTLLSSAATLTIQPGTLVKLAPDVLMQVNGPLVARGTPAYPITLTCMEPGEQWEGMLVLSGAILDAELQYLSGTIFENIQYSCGGGITLDGGNSNLLRRISFRDVGRAPLWPGMTCGNPWVYFPQSTIVVVTNDANQSVVSVLSDNECSSGTCSIALKGLSACYPAGDSGSPVAHVLRNKGISLMVDCRAHSITAEDNHLADLAADGPAGAISIRRNALSTVQLAGREGRSYLFDYNVVGATGSLDIQSGATEILSNTIMGGIATAQAIPGGLLTQNNIGGAVVNLSSNNVDATQNFWFTTNSDEIDGRIYDFYDDWHLGIVSYEPTLADPNASAPAALFSSSLSPPSPLGTGFAAFTLDFTKPMSTTMQPIVTFGVDPSYDTHIVAGDWISPTRWVGTHSVTFYTGDGVQRLRVAGAVGANDGMEIPEDTRFTFEIATIGATSIDAQPGYGHVSLSWMPSELETIAGYNLYRATQSGGPYTRLNSTILTGGTYTDTNVVNGTPYYYVLRLLTTDLYELEYGSETGATPNDYTGPTTPVVVDDGACSPYANQLHAIWSASDPDSGISEYQYSIGTWAGGVDVINWTSAGTQTEVTRTGLSLIEGVGYYFNVKAKNGVGTWSSVASSDGILVSSGCPSADFSATPLHGCCPLGVQFTDESSGAINSWLWEFGDGETSVAQHPSHTYDIAGTFTVTLTVGGPVASNTKSKAGYIEVAEECVYLPLVLRNY